MRKPVILIEGHQRQVNIGSYNDFWFDRGNDGFTIEGQYRTLILTYPENGRMPSRTRRSRKAEAAPKFAWPERDGAWWLETGISLMMGQRIKRLVYGVSINLQRLYQ